MADEKPRAWHSFVAASLTLLVIFAALASLSVLLVTMGLKLILVVAAVLAAVMFFLLHYVVWGWWLGPAIHRDAEAEEDDRPGF